MLYFVALIPPFAFLLLFLWMDSFALVKKETLLLSFFYGMIAVPIAYYAVTYAGHVLHHDEVSSPIIEECIKGLFILSLIKTRRCAFFIDAALYAATIGTGFSFLENIIYLYYNPDMMLGTAIVRGFGTAIMHCGCVISTAAILSWIANNKKNEILLFPVAALPAFILHIAFNNASLPPLILLLVTILCVSVWTLLLFVYNERSISKWIEGELSAEVKMLSALKKGTFSDSRAGQYMLSVKEQFEPECFFDMFCYVRIYYELSLASKTNMIRAEAGFPVVKSKATSEMVTEFYTLKKRIGKTAQITLSPIIKLDRVNLWKIESLAK